MTSGNIHKPRKAIDQAIDLTKTSDLYVVIKVCIQPRRRDKFFHNFDEAGLWVSPCRIRLTLSFQLANDCSPSFLPRPSYFINILLSGSERRH